MTPNSKTPKAADAPASEKRPTSPGLGDQSTQPEAQAQPSDAFDPNKFQAHRMPPGFLAELVALELPSMPKERLQDTLPPIDIATVLGSEEPIHSTKAEATTLLEVPNTSAPPPVQVAAPRQDTKSVVFRMVLPVALLSFAAGGLVIWFMTRGNVQGVSNAEATTSTPTARNSPQSAAPSVPIAAATAFPSAREQQTSNPPAAKKNAETKVGASKPRSKPLPPNAAESPKLPLRFDSPG